MKLNKEDLVSVLRKFDSILDNSRNNFDEPKGKFTTLQSNLITSTLNSKLSDRLLNLE